MADIGIFVGTMYGNGLLVAEEAEAILSGLGHKAKVFEDPEIQDWEPYSGKYVLVVTVHHRSGRSAGQHRSAV